MSKNFFHSLFFFAILLFSGFTYAKSINMYEEPKDGAKVVSSLDSDNGLIPIFSPEKGDWIKVADPRNGNVGWVKVSDLGEAGKTEFTFTQRFINTGKSPQTYQIIQFGSPQKLSPAQVQSFIQQKEQQQMQIQENINKAMQNMVTEMHDLYQNNASWLNSGTPIIMPVIVLPNGNNQTGDNSKK